MLKLIAHRTLRTGNDIGEYATAENSLTFSAPFRFPQIYDFIAYSLRTRELKPNSEVLMIGPGALNFGDSFAVSPQLVETMAMLPFAHFTVLEKDREFANFLSNTRGLGILHKAMYRSIFDTCVRIGLNLKHYIPSGVQAITQLRDSIDMGLELIYDKLCTDPRVAPSNLRVICADLYNCATLGTVAIGLRENQFDLIIATNVFCHVATVSSESIIFPEDEDRQLEREYPENYAKYRAVREALKNAMGREYWSAITSMTLIIRLLKNLKPGGTLLIDSSSLFCMDKTGALEILLKGKVQGQYCLRVPVKEMRIGGSNDSAPMALIPTIVAISPDVVTLATEAHTILTGDITMLKK